jgi:hypothetical protein
MNNYVAYTSSSATIPLGLVIWGTTLLTLDRDQGATACLLLATILDSKWGVMLPILVAFVAGRIASQGLWKGCVKSLAAPLG